MSDATFNRGLDDAWEGAGMSYRYRDNADYCEGYRYAESLAQSREWERWQQRREEEDAEAEAYYEAERRHYAREWNGDIAEALVAAVRTETLMEVPHD